MLFWGLVFADLVFADLVFADLVFAGQGREIEPLPILSGSLLRLS
jgi:hypothetical protein